MEALVKHEPQEDMDGPSITSDMLIMNSASVVDSIRQRQQQEELPSHRQQDGALERRRDQQVGAGDDKLQMMQTDEDPLLQETINALMSGAGGIEAVSGGGVTGN